MGRKIVIIRLLLPMVLALLMLSSCYNQARHTSDAWDLTEKQLDSISFSTTHHYSQNYNFVVKRDSIILKVGMPEDITTDSVVVRKNQEVVVADIMTIPADTIDSVWVKLARDQETQGWIHETDMLNGVAPNDPISQFIDIFSDTHLLIFMALLVIVVAAYSIRKLRKRHAMIVHFHDIDSIFPTMLALLVASSATIYASIQLFGAESWRHFYYHPSLNPFALPPHLGLFITSVWAIIIVLIATVDDIFRQLSIGDALLYMLGLAAVCSVAYVVFSISTLYYIGYPLLLAYYVYAIRQYMKHVICRFLCGNCGAKLTEKGVCPNCGAVNE